MGCLPNGADIPEIIPEEAAVVRRIYDEYLSGQSIGKVRKGLEKDGILIPQLLTEFGDRIIPASVMEDTWKHSVLHIIHSAKSRQRAGNRFVGDTQCLCTQKHILQTAVRGILCKHLNREAAFNFVKPPIRKQAGQNSPLQSQREKHWGYRRNPEAQRDEPQQSLIPFHTRAPSLTGHADIHIYGSAYGFDSSISGFDPGL